MAPPDDELDPDDLLIEDPPRPRATLPWMLVALLSVGLLAAIAHYLEKMSHHKEQLARARDEACDNRQQLLVAQDQAIRAEKERDEEKAKNAQLVAQLQASTTVHAGDEKLIADLKSKLDAKDGDVTEENDRVSVSLVDEILFKSGDANLAPAGQKVLARVGEVLKTLTDKQILIGGHTDDVPIHTELFPSNWELSSARAVTVVRYLSETVGVDPKRLAAAGYSQFHPRSKLRPKNRRIEILLTPLVEVKKSR